MTVTAFLASITCAERWNSAPDARRKERLVVLWDSSGLTPLGANLLAAALILIVTLLFRDSIK